MKKLLFLMLVFMISFSLFAKDDFDFNDVPKSIKYCRVIGTSFSLDTKPIIVIDFGQKWVAKKAIKVGGKIFQFNSMIDVLKDHTQFGWSN